MIPFHRGRGHTGVPLDIKAPLSIVKAGFTLQIWPFTPSPSARSKCQTHIKFEVRHENISWLSNTHTPKTHTQTQCVPPLFKCHGTWLVRAFCCLYCGVESCVCGESLLIVLLTAYF